VFEWEGKVIIALPGPPRELQPMVRDELTPYLQKRFGVRSPGSSITLRFVGIGQSLIDQTMSRSVPLPPDVVVGSQFEAGRVDFTFMLPGKGPEEEARLKELAAKLHDHLGEYIYADDGSSLEEQVVRMLLARGAELKLVEIGTGGRLAASLAGWLRPTVALVAFGIQYAGLLAERWFFFAQANHPQNLYYSAVA